MQTTFIPSSIFDYLTSGLAADMAKLQPDIVSGDIAPHQIAALLCGYGVMPEDLAKQVIEDMRENAAKELEAGISSIVRPAA
ncbi:hypothetical protein RU07_21825 [Agrobacterium tumefaciens]|uniref:Uncharacterized protein n=1 Tax=Agrobacterium tumefaciens TaxID=358 RepID=A0A0D0J1A8_AGRTU|nr:hypothetical protein RU07_21825 [Agrobacterium tumefaciens]